MNRLHNQQAAVRHVPHPFMDKEKLEGVNPPRSMLISDASACPISNLNSDPNKQVQIPMFFLSLGSSAWRSCNADGVLGQRCAKIHCQLAA